VSEAGHPGQPCGAGGADPVRQVSAGAPGEQQGEVAYEFMV
jgi:hypothetical protein